MFKFSLASIPSNPDGSILPTSLMASNVVEANQTASSDQTTVFVSDANANIATIMKPLDMDGSLRSSSITYNSQDIKTFLGKPYKLSTGVLSTTDTVSTFPSVRVPDNAMPSIFADKLEGYMGFRATVKFRILFNATRFQQGRYMMIWVPSGGAAGTNKDFSWFQAHTNTLTQRTQCQRIEFDISCDTEAVLEIPFTSILNYYPLAGVNDVNKVGSWGRLLLAPYVALTVDSGTPTVSYALYISYHDVELIGAATPQSGRVVKRGSNPTEQEQSSKNIGPVESAMALGLNVSNALTSVPLLSNFAQPASWIFDALRGTAAHFGWSKPANLGTLMRVNQNYAPYFGSVDNDDIGLPLSASVKNIVDPALGFSRTDIDELDFKYFATIPAYFTSAAWLTGTAVGSSLISLDVCPTPYVTTRAAQLPGVRDYTPVAYVASNFKFWRGSMVFKFKLVRTEFHSGRLSVCFYPYDDRMNAFPSFTYADSIYVNRHIIDVRESNEFTITVPYLNASPWLDAQNSVSAATGRLIVWVEDKLVAPSTVPQLCSILCEVAAGPDIEFAFPIPNYLTPALNAVPQSGEISRQEPRNDCSIVNASIGGTTLTENDIVNAGLCIGEKVSSFRTLLRHFNALPGTAALASSSYKNIIPFAFPTWKSDTVTAVAPSSIADLYGQLASCFLFSRGGVRLKGVLMNDTDATQKARLVMLYLSPRSRTSANLPNVFDSPGTTLISLNANAGEYSNGPKVLARLADSQPIEVSVPQYNNYHSRLNTEHSVSVSDPYNAGKQYINTPWAVDVQPLGVAAYNAYRVQWFRAGADDCNMGTFISIPPMVRNIGATIN